MGSSPHILMMLNSFCEAILGRDMQSKLTVIYEKKMISYPFMVSRCRHNLFHSNFHFWSLCKILQLPTMLASTASRKWISLWSKFFQDELNEGTAPNCTLLKTFLIKTGEIFLSTSPAENCWERCFSKAFIPKYIITRSLNKKHMGKKNKRFWLKQ